MEYKQVLNRGDIIEESLTEKLLNFTETITDVLIEFLFIIMNKH